MIQVTLEELASGHTLARTIYRDTGEVLLSAGFHMTAEVKQKLAELGQNRFWVHEEGLESVVSEELVSEQVVSQCASLLRKACLEFRAKLGLEQAKKDIPVPTPYELLASPIKIKMALPIRQFKQVASTLFQEIRRVDQSLLHMAGTRTTSSYLHQHAVEASIISGILAKRYAFSDSEIEDLMLGVLAMDIGQWLLPTPLFLQTTRLNLADYNLLREHPHFGFEMLRTDNAFPLVCAHVALQHQERQDGSGYPRKLTGTNQPPPTHQAGLVKNKIHRYAEIASVADEYLSLIAPRPGIPAKTPIQSIKHLLRIAGTQLNMSIVNTLISMIPIYTAGCRIVITEDEDSSRVGCIGVVEKSNPRHQNRPSIILVYDKEGKRIPAQPINLEEQASTQIREILPGKSWDTSASLEEEFDSPLPG